MTPPSDREIALCKMFESFCVRAIRNFGRNLKRAMKNRQKHDGTGEESVEYLIGLLSAPDKGRKVILYDFWCDLKDKEISEKLEVTVRTVYNLQQRAFKRIRTYYELYGQGRDP